MKNSSDTIGNRTRDIPSCSAVPQPTAPPRAPSTVTTVVYEFVTTSFQQTDLTMGDKLCHMSWPYELKPCRLVDDYRRNAGIYVPSSGQT